MLSGCDSWRFDRQESICDLRSALPKFQREHVAGAQSLTGRAFTPVPMGSISPKVCDALAMHLTYHKSFAGLVA